MFLGIAVVLVLAFFKGIDYAVEMVTKTEETSHEKEGAVKADTRGWSIGSVYAKSDNSLYQNLIKGDLQISTDIPIVKRNMATFKLAVRNDTQTTITLRAEAKNSESQDPITWSKRVLNEAVLFKGDSLERDLQIAIPTEKERRKVIVEIFVQSIEGETLSAHKILNLGVP